MYDGFYGSPPTYAHMREGASWLREHYSCFKSFPVGRSVLGRDITALCIGSPANSTFYVGATHGLEWLTGMILLRFYCALLHAWEHGGMVSDIDIRGALRERGITIIPCLNPDGVEIALEGAQGAEDKADWIEGLCGGADPKEIWQANANGVDLNHNFDAGWLGLHKMERESGITGPAPTRYGGPHPCSEPESSAITSFCLHYRPRSLYALHSQGEEIYYHYGKNTPTRSRMIAQILASSSGYALSRPSGLASHGGLKDWFIEKTCRPGFTIEVGKGKNPLGLKQLDPIYNRIEEALMLAALL